LLLPSVIISEISAEPFTPLPSLFSYVLFITL
jgi:hypothetical protein